MKRVISVAILTLVGGLIAMAKDSTPASRPIEPLIGQMRIATLPAAKFLFIELETTFAALPQDAGPAIDRVVAAAVAANVRFEGPLLFRYPAIKDLNAKFTMQIGFTVDANMKAPSGTKLTDLPASRCATLLYTGPMMRMRDAYKAIYQAIQDAGLQPAGESREAYFYFEAQESDNNVTQIQVIVR